MHTRDSLGWASQKVPDVNGPCLGAPVRPFGKSCLPLMNDDLEALGTLQSRPQNTTQETNISNSGRTCSPGFDVESWLESAGPGAEKGGLTDQLGSFGKELLILPGTIPICPHAYWLYDTSLTLSSRHWHPRQSAV